MQELKRAVEVIDEVSKQTDSILLFHSLSGKDSITLLDLCYPRFKRVVCVFMYIVKDLDHINRYLVYAKKKYPNVEFIQVPHYSLYNYIKIGFMGIQKNVKQRQWTLADITDKLREKLGIEWACFGFKQSDSLNRRLMLRSYSDGKEAICWKTKKLYPLSTYKNQDVIDYMHAHHLKNHEKYGDNLQSSGTDIMDAQYLTFLHRCFPQDEEKIYRQFPQARIVLMQANKDKK